MTMIQTSMLPAAAAAKTKKPSLDQYPRGTVQVHSDTFAKITGGLGTLSIIGGAILGVGALIPASRGIASRPNILTAMIGAGIVGMGIAGVVTSVRDDRLTEVKVLAKGIPTRAIALELQKQIGHRTSIIQDHTGKFAIKDEPEPVRRSSGSTGRSSDNHIPTPYRPGSPPSNGGGYTPPPSRPNPPSNPPPSSNRNSTNNGNPGFD